MSSIWIHYSSNITEIKHSRIAMLAFAGWVVGDIHNPVLGVSSVEAHNAAVASGAGAQIIAFIVALEFINCVAMKEMFDGSGRKPGEFGFDPAGFSAKLSPADKVKMEAKELENGRAAMLAFAGVVTQAVATGKPFPYI
jgi:Chlorophyll A-B binding protein